MLQTHNLRLHQCVHPFLVLVKLLAIQDRMDREWKPMRLWSIHVFPDFGSCESTELRVVLVHFFDVSWLCVWGGCGCVGGCVVLFNLP